MKYTNGRDRVLAAIDMEESDLVPIMDLGLDSPLVEKVTGEKAREFSVTSMSDTAKIASSRSTAWESSKQNLLQLIGAYNVLEFDAAIIHGYNLLSYDYTPKYIDQRKIIDEWGRIQKVAEGIGTTWWIGGTVKTQEDLDKYEPPDPSEPGRYEMLQQVVHKIDPDTAVIGCFPVGSVITWQVIGGIDKLILALYTDRAFVTRLRDKIHSSCMRWIKMMTDIGLDAFVISDDYADSHGPFLGPKLFRDFELPYLQRAVDDIRKRGVAVLQHSDGNLYPIIEDLIDAGIAGLHPIEPGAMDIADVKQRYGDRICLMGNVDCRQVLPYGTEAQVVAEVRRVIDAASAGGGHILMSSNSLHSNVKVENVFTMTAETRKYGRYPRARL